MFYAVDGKPYCEKDYAVSIAVGFKWIIVLTTDWNSICLQETLDKCTICNKPIMDRVCLTVILLHIVAKCIEQFNKSQEVSLNGYLHRVTTKLQLI